MTTSTQISILEQIPDYIVKGATHEQIMKWVGLNEKNYWKHIQAIREKD